MYKNKTFDWYIDTQQEKLSKVSNYFSFTMHSLLTYPCLGFKSVMFFLYELGVMVRVSQISPV